ncbi:MAG TPA: NDP-sugar synthase [Acidimicrobiia bacterium]|nr:NDP-sugar synthase [Acidimicrobiia bacterium]
MPRPASDAVSIRQAVLLVGGRGTRMWPLTSDVPKGLLPLAGVPFVEYQLRQLAAAGISEVFLAVGRELLGAWERYAATSPGGLAVRLVVEEEPLDTAGPVRAVLDLLDDRFLVLNGDVVVEADLAALVGDHGEATLGLVEVADTSAYGVVVTRSDGLVERFIEKPPTDQAPARTVNAGMYALTRATLAGYPEGPLSFEQVVFPALAAANALRGVLLTGRWIDIGTPSLYLAAHDVVYAGGSVLHRPAATHENAGAAVSGRLAGSWSWIGPGARIAPGAIIEESVVMSGAGIADGAVIRRGIIGHDASVGPGAFVGGAAVVGRGASVGAACELDHGMRVAPGATIEAGGVTFRPPN